MSHEFENKPPHDVDPELLGQAAFAAIEAGEGSSDTADREYDDDDCCTSCSAHIADPHSPTCPRAESTDDQG